MNLKKITLHKIKNYTKYKVSGKITEIRYKKYKLKKEDYNKILHVWDTAGVASLLSRELNKNGYQSDVIMRTIHDPFGFTKYYNQELVDLEGNPFDAYCKHRAEDYGIIHIHSAYRLVPKYKKAFPNKKIILQFHGAELINPDSEEELVQCTKQADAIICSTPDLEEYVLKHPELLKPYVCVNAIDTDLFKPMPEIQKVTNDALYIKISYINYDKVKQYLDKHCPWKVHVFDRDGGSYEGTKAHGTPYSEMPMFYNKYSKLIDVKIYDYLGDDPAQGWSKTGLEALACGLEVYNHKGDIVKGLPEKFTPKYQCEAMISIYNKTICRGINN